MDIDTVYLWNEFGAQTTLSQAEELHRAVLETPPGDVIEVGSATGGTTIVLIKAAELAGKHVYSVDPYPPGMEGAAALYEPGMMNRYREGFAKNILNGKYHNITQYNEDLVWCIDRIPERLSVVFIDGCHEFSFVQAEYEMLWPRLVEGGVLYVHDIYWGDGQVSRTAETGLTGVRDWLGKGEDIGNMLKIVK